MQPEAKDGKQDERARERQQLQAPVCEACDHCFALQSHALKKEEQRDCGFGQPRDTCRSDAGGREKEAQRGGDEESNDERIDGETSAGRGRHVRPTLTSSQTSLVRSSTSWCHALPSLTMKYPGMPAPPGFREAMTRPSR